MAVSLLARSAHSIFKVTLSRQVFWREAEVGQRLLVRDAFVALPPLAGFIEGLFFFWRERRRIADSGGTRIRAGARPSFLLATR
jgi:hypothetical protein